MPVRMDSFSAKARGQPNEEAEVEGQTVIFLDVDGVLNIGIRDPGNSALLLNDANLANVKKMAESIDRLPGPVRDNVVRMLATVDRELADGDTSYVDFACHGTNEVSEELVRRLAVILRAAGPKGQVVFASTWRWPQYNKRVKKLEAMLSSMLGQDFTFKQRTKLCTERGGQDRLRTIGDHMAMLGAKHDGSSPLNVLVIDDFSITGFKDGKMDIDEQRIRSPEDAAMYLKQRFSPKRSALLNCAVIHTYDEWDVNGVTVQIGSGLKSERVCEAVKFLGHKDSLHGCGDKDEKCTSTATTPDSEEYGGSDSDTASGSNGVASSGLDITVKKNKTTVCSVMQSMKYLFKFKSFASSNSLNSIEI